MKKNLRSANVMKKLGMKLEKEFIDPNYPGEELDVLYRIQRVDWLSR